MAQIIAPGVARFTLVGSANDGSYWNVIWDARLLGDVEVDREVMCLDYAKTLMSVWNANVRENVTNQYALTSVRWIDLDSADGSVGETSTTLGGEAGPFPGLSAELGLSLNSAMLITKLAQASRGTRNGRIYAPGYAEDEVGVSTWNDPYRAAVQADWNGFLTGATDPSADYSALPVVVHTRNAGTPTNPNIVYVSDTVITGLRCEQRLATQRRRLRRA